MADLAPLFRFDWSQVVHHLVHLLVAYLLAVPVAWNRERESRSAGIRTFPLVALGACGFALIAREAFTKEDAQARVIYGVVTGIGFIGGGAILKQGGHISGTATAAAVWCMGAIGFAVAYDKLEIALMVSLFIAATFLVVGKTKELVNGGPRAKDETEAQAEEDEAQRRRPASA